MTRVGLVLGFALGLMLAGCRLGEERVAGGGGVDVEGITVEGTTLRADRTPIPSALVRLRPWDFQRGPAAPKRAIDHADARTDSLGRFRFTDVDTGRYAVEVDAGAEGATVLEIEADGSRRVLTLQAVIQARGILQGTVRDDSGRGIAGAVVGILGLEREAVSDSAGAYTLADLPPGSYTVRIKPPGPAWSAVEIPLIEVRGGAAAMLDAVLPAAVPGLFAYWRFDEGKGDVAADALGSPARAVLRGTSAWAAGRDSLALSLPPAGQAFAFVPKTKSASLDIKTGADFTVAAWFRSAGAGAGTGATRRIVDTRTSYETHGYSLGLDAAGGAELVFLPTGAVDSTRIGAAGLLDDGQWHHLAAGRSGTRWFMYVDGNLAGETQGSADAVTATNALYFGSTEGKSRFFTGLIDDVRLYAHGLNSSEAKALATP